MLSWLSCSTQTWRIGLSRIQNDLHFVLFLPPRLMFWVCNSQQNCVTFEPLMYLEAVSERCWTSSCRESHRHTQDAGLRLNAGLRLKKDQTRENLFVVHHSAHTCNLPHHCSFDSPVFSRYARGLSLNTSCNMWGEETAVVLVAAETRWEHVPCVCSGNDITHSMTLTWQQRKAEGENWDTAVFNVSSLSHKDRFIGKPCRSQ